MGTDHAHGTTAGASRGRLTAVLAVTVAVLLAELVGGLLSGSLVLLTDAAHVGADAGGLAVSLVAVSLARRPPTPRRTFGLVRAEVLAALVNATLLLALGGWLLVEAVRRLVDPSAPDVATMLVSGGVAVAGNLLGVLLLRGAGHDSLVMRGAYLEVLADLLGAGAVLVAGTTVALTGLDRADPLASLLVGGLIVPRTWRLLRSAVDVLLESTPAGVDLEQVRTHILAAPGVQGCHDLHAWTITSGTTALSAHVVVADACWADGRAPGVLDDLSRRLAGHVDVGHCTFQLERPGHADHEPVPHD